MKNYTRFCIECGPIGFFCGPVLGTYEWRSRVFLLVLKYTIKHDYT